MDISKSENGNEIQNKAFFQRRETKKMTEHYLLTLHRQKENDSYKKLHTKIFIHVLVLVKLKIKKNKHKFITIM